MPAWSGEDARYRLLIDAIIDYAIYMIDAEGFVSSWNSGASRLKGYAAPEVLGRHFSLFYTREDREAGLPARAMEMARREGRFESEGWRQRKDGTRFWAHVVIDPIRDPEGTLLGFAKITRDLTERRAAQQALDAAQQALAQAQKMEAIGQLTGGIAHDFNNLLMVILGSLELLGRRLPDDPRLSPLLENAIQAAQRGSALTHRMLAFARRSELKFEAVDPAAVVSGLVELLRRSIGPSYVIRTDFQRDLPAVRSDANQLESALLNLCVNARDAMPQGGSIVIAGRLVEVGAGDRTDLAAGRYVCLSVCDTGEGMDATTLARAAEPFFTTKGVGKGTGLGLSMVQGLIEQSGGRLQLSSEPGQGTRVDLFLPAMAGGEGTAPAASAPFAHPPAGGPGLRILAVDDDALVLLNTRAMLEDLGHTVLPAHSAQEALQRLERGDQVDLVVSDHAMPRMTGVQLAAALSKDWPGLPFLLATGYAELPDDTARDIPRLPKPFTQKELEDAVLAAVHRRTHVRA